MKPDKCKTCGATRATREVVDLDVIKDIYPFAVQCGHWSLKSYMCGECATRLCGDIEKWFETREEKVLRDRIMLTDIASHSPSAKEPDDE